MEAIEQATRWVGAVLGLGTLSVAVAAMLRAVRRPAGRQEPVARLALRAPILMGATLAFLTLLACLWHPLPVDPSPAARALLLGLGGLSLVVGCSLYLWGLRTLGVMFGPSSGFGVRLHANHRLIETGPYAVVRHPMYLAVLLASSGGLLLYRTWAMLAFALLMFGLVVRAHREDRMLDSEFGDEWRRYADRVPAWLPRIARRRTPGSGGPGV